jgi:hypothetical protein
MSVVTVDSEVLLLAFGYWLRHPVKRDTAIMVERSMIDQRDSFDAEQRRWVSTEIHNAIANGRPRAAEEVERIQRVAAAMA